MRETRDNDFSLAHIVMSSSSERLGLVSAMETAFADRPAGGLPIESFFNRLMLRERNLFASKGFLLSFRESRADFLDLIAPFESAVFIV